MKATIERFAWQAGGLPVPRVMACNLYYIKQTENIYILPNLMREYKWESNFRTGVRTKEPIKLDNKVVEKKQKEKLSWTSLPIFQTF